MVQGTRGELVSRLAEAIRSVTTARPLRVAIDGPPAAGKTTLADELAVVLRAQDRDVIRAGIDDFLSPRAQRYRRGQYSAEGCYFDAHDHAALCRVLLDPLGPGGDRRFQHASTTETPTPQHRRRPRPPPQTPSCSSTASSSCAQNSSTGGTCGSSCPSHSSRR